MNLKIISANIRFDNPADKPNDWPARRSVFSDAINSFEADLLGTQEGRRPQLKDLESLLPNLELADGHRDWITERMYPCIFFNPNKISVNRSGDIWLSETPYKAATKSFDSAFPRLCTWIEGQFKENSQNFFYVNLHLDHLQSHTREGQANVMLSEIARQNTSNYPVFITGDFNESPGETVHKLILEKGPNLQDSWLTNGNEEEASHHKFGNPSDDASRIDWILIDKSVSVKSVYLYKENENNIFPSDHYPVFGEFSL